MVAVWGRGVRATLGPVDSNEEFCSVVQISIGELRILMAAEIDCTADRAGSGPGTAVAPGYVELKTTKQFESARDHEMFAQRVRPLDRSVPARQGRPAWEGRFG